jgi:hypothetical protein
MLDLRLYLLASVVSIVSLGTRYSLIHSTYLDTSDPFVTQSHPLSDTHYFASKKNLLNTLFLKRAWGWTTLVALPLILTAPRRRLRRVTQYVLATLSWAAFTTWFFGPGIIERLISLTGGVCVVQTGKDSFVPVPVEYCYNRERISHSTHPHLFPPPLLAIETNSEIARLRKGHDVSGHVFLLTLCVLFLGDQIVQSLARKRSWNQIHGYTVFSASAIVALWLFSLWVTSVYFHTAFEKYTGLRMSFQ